MRWIQRCSLSARPALALSLTGLLLLSCQGIKEGMDLDGDGFKSKADCDDMDRDAWPGGLEICDGVDNNCDGEVDEPTARDASTWYLDQDGDGYGLSSESVSACELPEHYTSDRGDCDDQDSSLYPDHGCDGPSGLDTDPADGPDWDGTYAGTITLDLDSAELAVSDRCTGELEIEVDEDLIPELRARCACIFEGELATFGTLDVRLDGTIYDDGLVDGTIWLNDEIEDQWYGEFESEQVLVGEFMGDAIIYEADALFKGSFRVSRPRV